MIKVVKKESGIPSQFNERVWEMIGGDNNKEGWVRVSESETPPEIVELKAKTAAKQEDVVGAGETSTKKAPVKNK